jgi:hypothetical protein
MFRSYEVNQSTEARGLEKRYRGKGRGGVRIETRARMETTIAARVRIRGKVRIEVEWVLSTYLVEINKSLCKDKRKGNRTVGG